MARGKISIALMCSSKFYIILIIAISAFLCSKVGAADGLRKRDYTRFSYYAVEVLKDSLISPKEIATLLNVTYEGPIGELENHYLFSFPKTISSEKKLNKRGSSLNNIELSERDDSVIKRWNSLRHKRSLAKRSFQIVNNIISVEKQKLRRLHKRIPAPPHIPAPNPEDLANHQKPLDVESLAASLGISDPGFKYQWHLVRCDSITGKGVVVALVDDGLDMYSEDLKDSYFAEGSYDFNDHNPTPKPKLSDDQHGTRCAGEIAAQRNDVCGVGIAWDAKVSGIRILSAEISDADEAEALNYKYHQNHIYSCSWGPPDDGQSVEAPHGLILKAMINGIENGRSGKGSLYVFASGNGGANDDNCNFDGYTNSIYTITVGAVDRNGGHPFYSERCSALLITTYSSGSGSYIYTTDVGQRVCSTTHGGTSAAAPIAAGIFALVLEVRPDLTWRDMQYLALTSAVPFDLGDDDWSMTAAGRYFSHKFGYGKIDAYKIVRNARTFKNLEPQTSIETEIININQRIPMDDEGLLSSVEVFQSQLDSVNFSRLEHVTVTVNIDHTRRGDIEVDLISPKLVRSKLAFPRRFDVHRAGLENWTFMSVKHWDESPVGVWTLQVRDRNNPNDWGVFINWTMKFWGEKKKVGEVPLPSSATPTASTVTKVSEPSTTSTTPSETASTETPLEDTNTDSVVKVIKNSNWHYAIIGMGTALVLAGLVYYGKRCFCAKRNKKREGYEFAVLSEDDGRFGDEDLIPLGSGKQLITSREIFAAFGDSDEEEDDEKSQVVYDNVYMDAYKDDVPEEINEDEETIIQGEGSGSGSTTSVEGGKEQHPLQTPLAAKKHGDNDT
ncbi:11321_t:CDS:2 [Ambispora leptoticha]|uniref:11321_t:CDS:1 n=1 Tax=Ambispora leptoticha TaxID=144679 RepID=A0A9N8VSC7_9GLOM|nr:11321_t:CDS:2 [Ambispora leptoticha]